jgi:pseudomonalisin/xanthomonalisin
MNSLRSRTFRPLLLAVASACALAGAGSGHAASPAWTATRTLAVDASGLKAGPEASASTPIHVAVSLRLRNEAALDALVADLLAGRSQARLSSQEVIDRFAPTAAQAEAVAAYLRAAGFANVAIAGNRMLVTGDGTAAAAQGAFNTTLRHFEVEGHDALGNEQAAQVPAELAGIVNAVHGLDTTNPLHLHHQRADRARASAQPDEVVGHEPKEFATIYDADSLPPATDTTIAIMAAGDISQSLTDLAAFIARNGYETPKVKQVFVGQRSGDTAGVLEWDLDSQTSIAVAGGKINKLIFYIATNVFSLTPFVEAFNQAVVDDSAQIVNASLGTCEIGEHSNGDEAAIDASFKMGIAQGQTFTISSGDSGARECSNSITGGESYPAVSPYATAIGGTTLSTNGQTEYMSETVWSGGGGGMSVTEKEPKYQKKALTMALTGRGIPDISFSASPASGCLVVVDGGARLEQVGGTSLSAPMFMGFWARIQTMQGNALVSPNKAIYRYTKKAANAALYTHDVTSGSNGYTAGPGWDLGSGYGSLDVAAFAAFVDTHAGF